ncbi:MAG: DUF6282 family protein, partial [Dehalococcoidia bacterium]|nr:DUF6282 family protein [Dehalococcoidia bacterium]
MSVIDELLEGSIDTHVHMDPDPSGERRHNAIELALSVKEAGMAGVVMKSKDYPSAPIVWAVSQFVKDVGLYGSIVLNSAVGGLNPEAVEVAARLGAKIVWMPTQTAKNDIRGSSAKGVGVYDENGRLVPEVYDILDIVRKFDIVVATGHLGHQASFAVIDAAREKGIKKIIYTHAMLGL